MNTTQPQTTTHNISITGLESVATDSPGVTIVIGGRAEADCARPYTDDPILSVWGDDPREAINALMAKIDLSSCKRVVVIAPPSGKRSLLAGELVRRLDPDCVFESRDDDWRGEARLCDLGPTHRAEVVRTVRQRPIPELVDDWVDQIMHAYDHPEESKVHGVKTGWDEFDKHYMPAPGHMTLITGVPSHGKSSFLDALLINLTHLHGWQHMVFSPESFPSSRHGSRLAARAMRQPHEGAHRMDRATMLQGAKFVNDNFSMVKPDVSMGLDRILEIASSVLRRKGINGLVIDHWRMISALRPKGMELKEYVGVALAQIQMWARTHNVHAWLVVHPTKPPSEKRAQGAAYVPGPYDISDSADWFGKADSIMAVWRDVQDTSIPVQVHVQKVRVQPEQGTTGVVEFTYEPSIGIYHQVVTDGVSRLPAKTTLPGLAKLTERVMAKNARMRKDFGLDDDDEQEPMAVSVVAAITPIPVPVYDPDLQRELEQEREAIEDESEGSDQGTRDDD